MIARRIADESGLPVSKIITIANRARHSYKTYQIQKRSGGLRKISQPSKQLKGVQRWLVKNIFSNMDVHEAAMAYRKNINISQNAAVHQSSRYLLKTDFRDFFPSITHRDIRQLLLRDTRRPQLTPDDIDFILKIVCHNGCLSIGAPSSPVISNLVMWEFDVALSTYCEERGAKYTRYADDISISTNHPGALDDVFGYLQNYLSNMDIPNLTLNDNKTIFVSKKKKRIVTGLVLTSDGRVSLGRDKKRYLKSMVHKFLAGDLDVTKQEELKGWLSYVQGVEPSFISSLEKKYDVDVSRMFA